MIDATKERLENIDAESEKTQEKHRDRVEKTLPNGVFVSTSRQYLRNMARVEALIKPLESILNLRCADGADRNVQDATFFTDIFFASQVLFRFSSYGDLFTVCLHSDYNDADRLNAAVKFIESSDFAYVSVEDLGELYTGANDYYRGSTWWYRFFEYQ